VKRFGSIFPFLETGRQPRQLGRLVANYEFVRALLKFSRFDEFVFSNSSLSNLATFADMTRGWGVAEDRLARVQFTSYAGLPAVLREKAFHVFHLGGWGWFMPGLHYLRARYASNPWPITAITHSLDGRDLVDHAVRLSIAGGAPYDAIFCTSRDGREALGRLLDGGAAIAGRAFRGRLEHLPLGIDDDLLSAPGDRAGCRARLRIPADAVVLLVLGRISPLSKMDLGPLLRAFARDIVPRSPRPVVLLLAGSASPDQLALVQQDIERAGLAPHARVYPNFPLDQRPHILAAADVLVSPVDNTQETFGLSLLEAMSAGLPVVASRFDGYKDLVTDEVDGFLIDTYRAPADPMAEWFDVTDATISQLFQSQGVAVDMPQLVDRVLRLIGDEGLRAAMGRAGRAKVDGEYRWSRVIARYEDTWDGLAAEAQTTGPAGAGDNPYNLGPGRIFPHYSTRALTRSERLVSSGEPLDVRPYNETTAILEPSLLARLQARAVAGGDAGVTVADLLAAGDVPEAQAWSAVLWLLKYGALRLTTTSSSTPRAPARG
jgi:glycosyltransferase involved in cell wall biosynthesis